MQLSYFNGIKAVIIVILSFITIITILAGLAFFHSVFVTELPTELIYPLIRDQAPPVWLFVLAELILLLGICLFFTHYRSSRHLLLKAFLISVLCTYIFFVPFVGHYAHSTCPVEGLPDTEKRCWPFATYTIPPHALGAVENVVTFFGIAVYHANASPFAA